MLYMFVTWYLNMAENNNEDENTQSNSFEIQLIYDSFTKCSSNINALDMDHYLLGFKELYRFFGLMGSVFSFVASDIISKVTILENYRLSENADHYKTLQSMIEYECTNRVVDDTSRPSGCRTLLRLNWALEFIMSFMKEMSEALPDAKSSRIAQKCYKESLGKYHPWWIQQGANLAMYSLPARQQFLENVLGKPCDAETISKSEKLMRDIANVSKVIFEETHKLYEESNLLSLK